MAEVVRKELGPYMSAECFRFLRLGAEDTAGRALIVNAGKQRGHSLEDILAGVGNDEATLTTTLNRVLGKEGTRLCIVDEVKKVDNGYRVTIRESACSAGMQTSEPNCAFTLGVFIGALEVVTKKRLLGHEIECIATGHDHCLYELEAL